MSDPRVDGYWFMGSPFPTMAICAFYVYFVKSLGPRLMKDRPAFDLKNTIIVYNIIQVVFSIWIVYKVSSAWNVTHWLPIARRRIVVFFSLLFKICK